MRAIRVTASLLILIAADRLAHAEDACATNAFRVVGSIERIEPPGAGFTILRSDGTRVGGRLLDCLLPGDQLLFTGRATAVELFIAGAPRRVVAADSPYMLANDLGARVEAIGKALVDLVRLPPRETGAALVRPRTRTDAALQVSSMSRPGVTGSQHVLEGQPVVVAWRANQDAAWRVRVRGVPGTAQEVVQSAEGAFAVLRLGAPAVGRDVLIDLLDDLRNPVLTWRTTVTDVSAVPAPAWLDGGWAQWTSVQRIGWATWVLRDGPADWSLQALAVLHEARAQFWISGHIFYRAVNGTLAAHSP